MTNRVRGAEYRTTTICIDTCENGVLTGRLYNPYMNEGKRFQSMMQLLLEMEKVLNTMDFPQSSSTIRTFLPMEERSAGPSEKHYRMGAAATFEVRVLFRQNVSWQGSVCWLEARQEQYFRSVLELILLIDNALSCAEAS